MSTPNPTCVGFIGGGNMASAIIGGLRAAGWPAERIHVVEPHGEARERLQQAHGVQASAAPSAMLSACGAIVWAVKPQQFAEASRSAAPWVCDALHISIVAGLREAVIALGTGATRVVRAMPNTPAVIGMGMTALYRGQARRQATANSSSACLRPLAECCGSGAKTSWTW